MKTLVKLFGIAVLIFLTANCNSSKTVVTESNIPAVEPETKAEEKSNNSDTTQVKMEKIQITRKPTLPSSIRQ